MKSILLFLISLQIASFAFANEIAFTFDDAPRGDKPMFTGVERTRRIIETLKKNNIQTVFFVNSHNFTNANGRERIQAYADAGHLIANHTHSHPRLKNNNTSNYINDIDKADELIKSFSTYTKWFRYPFLHEGESIKNRDDIRKHLSKIGYKNGYVTVDNYDYFIDDLLQKALAAGKKVNTDAACGMLTDLMWDGIKFYDIGSIRHVLLMHENDIEAICLEKLISFINKKGWKIISPQRAFEDPLMAAEPETLYLNQGRVAAIVHVKTGIKHRSKWENEAPLRAEFIKRKIVTSQF
jgi:peptidoglycan-N-acetylglucosamine deacetylase